VPLRKRLRESPLPYKIVADCTLTRAQCTDRLTLDDTKAIIERARTDKLRTDLVLQRARLGQMFDGADATCAEITKIIEVDQKALEQEVNLLKDMTELQKLSQTGELKANVKVEVDKIKKMNGALSAKIDSLKYDESVKCGTL